MNRSSSSSSNDECRCEGLAASQREPPVCNETHRDACSSVCYTICHLVLVRCMRGWLLVDNTGWSPMTSTQTTSLRAHSDAGVFQHCRCWVCLMVSLLLFCGADVLPLLTPQAEGLSSLPVNDLGGIIARIAASRMARDPQTNTQQELPVPAAAAATDAAVATAGEGAGSSSSSSLPPIVQEAMPQAWKALASVAGKMVEMFRPVAFVENTDTDTQVRAAVGFLVRRQTV